MSRYCLDTSAYSHFQRGDKGVIEILDRAEWLGVPAVTLGELRAGFLLGSRPDDNETNLRLFLANPVVEELPADGDVSLHYAEIVADLRRAGTPLPTNDIWIAATAMQHGLRVLTTDAHYLNVPQILVDHVEL